jgi:hypothetical protein
MKTTAHPAKGAEKILVALAVFGYLTAEQITRLLFAPSSLSYVRKLLKSLLTGGFVLVLGGKAVNLPLIYTLSGVGRSFATAMGTAPRKRFRPSEEQDKSHNPYFLKHTMAVTDVLIAAQLLSQTHPSITLSRMITERELKRKISVELPGLAEDGRSRLQTITIEPDAGLHFLITETWHTELQTWEDFFFIELYRNLPPAEWRFKQKIKAYVSYALNGWHERFFQTPVLSIVVIAATESMATTLKRWTEEALMEIERPEEGNWFFFRSIDTATANPEEMYVAPVWERAFGTSKTPLLVLE